MKTFTLVELKAYDGTTPDKPVYIGYKGKVYDVTQSPLFIDGMHFEHYAGCDMTEYMDDAPHDDEVIAELQVVGELAK